MKTASSIFPMRKTVLLNVLIVTALAGGLGVSAASAETAAPQAHSDGVVAAIRCLERAPRRRRRP